MATKPSEFPEWASSGAISIPDETERAIGWTDAAPPSAEFFNWFQNLCWKWFLWLGQTHFAVGDLFADQALTRADQDLPSVGAGLVIGPGPDFDGKIYTEGQSVGPVSFPLATASYTYTDNSDTYWFIDNTASFIPVIVANSGTAYSTATPTAPNGSAILVYEVATVAGARVGPIRQFSTPYRKVNQLLDLTEVVRLGESQLVSNARSATFPRLESRFRTGAVGYTFLWKLVQNVDTQVEPGGYLYWSHEKGKLVLVYGAQYNGTTTLWVPDPTTDPQYMRRIMLDREMSCVYVPDQGGPFTDSVWDAAETSAANSVRKGLISPGGFAGGSFGNDFEQGEVPVFRASVSTGNAVPGLMELLGDYYRSYTLHQTSNGLDSTGLGLIEVTNAWRASSSGNWHTIDDTAPAYLFEKAKNGFKIYFHGPADGNTWPNSVGSGNWIRLFTVNNSGIAAPGTITTDAVVVSGPITANSATITTDVSVGGTLTAPDLNAGHVDLTDAKPAVPVANRAVGASLLKAWGVIQLDGAGGFGVATNLYNVDVADITYPFPDTVRVTFKTNFGTFYPCPVISDLKNTTTIWMPKITALTAQYFEFGMFKNAVVGSEVKRTLADNDNSDGAAGQMIFFQVSGDQ